ncbi:hypothetical protein RRG08_043411 [Elysia crispata]|uniref:Uncharacterized protein n=1 Tax=Elysia crispata TaxID=231223 RepID=A0AAE1ATP0_9GAST|nr:hypothetical protein RRG08_043411 [Elysia crispata]
MKVSSATINLVALVENLMIKAVLSALSADIVEPSILITAPGLPEAPVLPQFLGSASATGKAEPLRDLGSLQSAAVKLWGQRGKSCGVPRFSTR